MAIKNLGTSTMRLKEGLYITGSVEQTGGSTLQDFSLINSGSIYNEGNIFLDGKESASDETYIQFMEAGGDRAKIGINTSNNLVLHNQYINKHIVFKVNDQGNTREGLRIDGAVPEVVVNEGSESLVDFRVESNNNTHMLFVDGGNDRVGVGISNPTSPLHVYGNLDGTFVATIDNDENTNGHVLKLLTDGNGSGSRLLEMEDGDGDTLFRARADGRFGFGPGGVSSMGAGTFVVGIANSSHTADIAISQRLQHLGDSNTYLDFPSNDNITFAAGGSEELKIASDAVLVKEYIKHDGDDDTYIRFQDNDVRIATAGSERVTVDPSGKVGIGTSSPSAEAKLDVVGNAVVSGSLYVNLGASGEALKIVGTLDHNSSLVFEQPAGSNRASIGLDGGDNLDIINYSSNDDINFFTTSGAGTYAGMVITAINRVGVGQFGWAGKTEFGTSESFPSCELDVSGSMKVSETATITGATSIEPFVVETKNALQGTSTVTAALRDESFSGLSNKDFSFSCWYYANDSNSVGLSSNTRIVFFGAGEHHNLKLGIPDIQIIYENNAGSNQTATFDTNLAEGNWYHIVAHFDVGDLSNGVPKVWVNGVEYSHGGFTAPGGTAATIDDVAIYLDDGSAMQDAVFWDKLLTQEEINELYDDGFWQDPSQTSISKNIVSWWKLGYEDSWAGLGFSAGDTLSGTINLPNEIGTNEFTLTNENEFALLARSVNRRSKSDFTMDITLLAGQVTIKDSVDVTNKSTFGGAVQYGLRDVNSTSAVEANDYVLRCIQNGAITITLPPKNDHRGRVLIFKDTLGNAATHNITIDADGSETIDGNATYVISHNKEAITLMCDGINGWMLLSRIRP